MTLFIFFINNEAKDRNGATWLKFLIKSKKFSHYIALTHTQNSKHLDDHEYDLRRVFVSPQQTDELIESLCLS